MLHALLVSTSSSAHANALTSLNLLHNSSPTDGSGTKRNEFVVLLFHSFTRSLARSPHLQHIIAACCGALHSLALSATHEVYAWGDNSLGQCGLGPESAQLEQIVQAPALVPRLLGLKIIAVACGAAHSVVLSHSGKAFAFGVGRQGQLGCGPMARRCSEPTPVVWSHWGNQVGATVGETVGETVVSNKTGPPIVTAVACGISHSVFLLVRLRQFAI